MVFEVSYIIYYGIKLRREQALVIHNHGNKNVRNIEQGDARHRKYKKFKFDGIRTSDHSSDKTAVIA
jgi:hypothetical protein